MSAGAPQTFEEFWAWYLGQHRRPGTRALHYAGGALFWGGLAAALLAGHWAPAVAGVVAGYAVSWAGHLWVEGNRPATWGRPLWSGLAELRMLVLAVAGRAGREVAAFYGSPDPAPDAPLRTDELVRRRREALRVGPDVPEHPFTTYWPVFVLKHSDPRNVALHVAGVVWFYGFLAAGLASPWWLLALPGSQLLGLVGHRRFEPAYVDPRDAVYSVRAALALNRLFWLVLTRRYAGEVRRVTGELEAWRAARAATSG